MTLDCEFLRDCLEDEAAYRYTSLRRSCQPRRGPGPAHARCPARVSSRPAAQCRTHLPLAPRPPPRPRSRVVRDCIKDEAGSSTGASCHPPLLCLVPFPASPSLLLLIRSRHPHLGPALPTPPPFLHPALASCPPPPAPPSMPLSHPTPLPEPARPPSDRPQQSDPAPQSDPALRSAFDRWCSLPARSPHSPELPCCSLTPSPSIVHLALAVESFSPRR